MLKILLVLLFSTTVFASYVIPTGGVGNSKLANLAVTTAKLADGAVTQAKRAALNIVTSGSSGTYSQTGGTPTDVTNMSLSITTTGRPVQLCVQGDGSGNHSFLEVDGTSNTSVSAIWTIVRGSTTIMNHIIGLTTDNNSTNDLSRIDGGFCFVDSPSAGTYTYKVQSAFNSSIGTGTITELTGYMVLTAFEL